MKPIRFIARNIALLITTLVIVPLLVFFALPPLLVFIRPEALAGTVAVLAFMLYFASTIYGVFLMFTLARRWQRQVGYRPSFTILHALAPTYRQEMSTATYAQTLRYQFYLAYQNEVAGARGANLTTRFSNWLTRFSLIRAYRSTMGNLRQVEEVESMETGTFCNFPAEIVSTYMDFGTSNILPVIFHHTNAATGSTDSSVTGAYLPELEESYRQLGIPYRVSEVFESNLREQFPLWVRALVPASFNEIGYGSPALMRTPTGYNSELGKNITAYPRNAWQQIAAIALAHAAFASVWPIPRSTIFDILDAHTGNRNFIVADESLDAQQMYQWARSELFGENDAEYTDPLQPLSAAGLAGFEVEQNLSVFAGKGQRYEQVKV